MAICNSREAWSNVCRRSRFGGVFIGLMFGAFCAITVGRDVGFPILTGIVMGTLTGRLLYAAFMLSGREKWIAFKECGWFDRADEHDGVTLSLDEIK